MALRRSAFTLIEILIVVVILGIIAAIVSVRFTAAIDQAQVSAAQDQLKKIRTAVEMYHARYGAYPAEAEVADRWEVLREMGMFKGSPRNAMVRGTGATVISFAATPDDAPTDDYGWIYDQASGRVWAAHLDENDQPLE